jgi:hypothetical protein
MGISLDAAQLDIEPNGLSHPVDIAMKRREDVGCYAVNDESAAAEEFCLPRHYLEGAEFTVRVTLRGANTEQLIAEFSLKNPGIGGTISLTPLGSD